jgi:flagellar biosynthesis protein FliQ
VNADTVTALATQALTVTAELALPFLLASLVVGLAVSVFQAVTSIQEQTLTFIPKIVVTVAVIALTGPWMLDRMITYVTALYTSIPSMVGP